MTETAPMLGPVPGPVLGPTLENDPGIRDPWAGEPWNGDARVGEILDIVGKEAGLDLNALLPDATIEALGIASLDLVQAIFEIESRFDVEIPPVSSTAATEFATVGDLVTHVLATLGNDLHPKAAPAGQTA